MIKICCPTYYQASIRHIFIQKTEVSDTSIKSFRDESRKDLILVSEANMTCNVCFRSHRTALHVFSHFTQIFRAIWIHIFILTKTIQFLPLLIQEERHIRPRRKLDRDKRFYMTY